MRENEKQGYIDGLSVPIFKILKWVAEDCDLTPILKRHEGLTVARVREVLEYSAEHFSPKETPSLDIYVDGASKGNPGHAGCGVVVFDRSDPSGYPIREVKRYIGRTTNNVAEYNAIILGLEVTKEMKARDVRIFSDSRLVVRQINGEYKIKEKSLRSLYPKVIHLMREFEKVTVSYIPRQKNKEANRLADMASFEFR